MNVDVDFKKYKPFKSSGGEPEFFSVTDTPNKDFKQQTGIWVSPRQVLKSLRGLVMEKFKFFSYERS